jgi:hypothetical protein
MLKSSPKRTGVAVKDMEEAALALCKKIKAQNKIKVN